MVDLSIAMLVHQFVLYLLSGIHGIDRSLWKYLAVGELEK